MVEALVEEAKLIMAKASKRDWRRATKAPKPKPKPTARCCSTTEGPTSITPANASRRSVAAPRAKSVLA